MPDEFVDTREDIAARVPSGNIADPFEGGSCFY